jgi:integrase/recombinase XerD
VPRSRDASAANTAALVSIGVSSLTAALKGSCGPVYARNILGPWTERHNTIRSRNARFVALRSFLHFAARKEPAAQGTIQSVLALPMKRFERPLLGHLTREEIEAMLDAPEGNTWCGQRDRVMLATLYNTGARVSERISLTIRDVVLERSSCVHLHGKGRKQRTVPLWRTTASLLRDWLRSHRRAADQPLFPTARAAP